MNILILEVLRIGGHCKLLGKPGIATEAVSELTDAQG